MYFFVPHQCSMFNVQCSRDNGDYIAVVLVSVTGLPECCPPPRRATPALHSLKTRKPQTLNLINPINRPQIKKALLESEKHSCQKQIMFSATLFMFKVKICDENVVCCLTRMCTCAVWSLIDFKGDWHPVFCKMYLREVEKTHSILMQG